MDQAFTFPFLGVLRSRAVVVFKKCIFEGKKKWIFAEEKKAHKRTVIVKP